MYFTNTRTKLHFDIKFPNPAFIVFRLYYKFEKKFDQQLRSGNGAIQLSLDLRIQAILQEEISNTLSIVDLDSIDYLGVKLLSMPINNSKLNRRVGINRDAITILNQIC